MKLIESKAELIQQPSGLEGVYRQIELCGRTCYKSEDKITEDSAKGFVDRMIKSNHTAMLEHGTVYLFIKVSAYDTSLPIYITKYEENPYSRVISIGVDDKEPSSDGNYYDILGNEATGDMQYVITTNLRVLVENGWLDDLKYICEPTEYHERRYTMKLTTDRGVSHELVRHRVFSFAQESTRYCNYSKDKFGGELTFIKPSWKYTKTLVSKEGIPYNGVPQFDGDYFEDFLARSEKIYFTLLDQGWTPQEARQVLPNALKTEICMTGFESDWKHFLDLRYFEVTGKAHPDMKELATKIVEQFKSNNIKIE